MKRSFSIVCVVIFMAFMFFTRCSGTPEFNDNHLIPEDMRDYIEEADTDDGVYFKFSSTAEFQEINQDFKNMLTELMYLKFEKLNKFAKDKVAVSIDNVKITNLNTGSGYYSHKMELGIKVKIENDEITKQNFFVKISEPDILTVTETDKLAVSGTLPNSFKEKIDDLLLDFIVEINNYIDRIYEID